MKKIELEDHEIKSIVDILDFSLQVCPIESVGKETQITREMIKNLIEKLEKNIESV